MTTSGQPAAAVVGTGAIGAPAARRLCELGCVVSAWDVAPGRSASLGDSGVRVAERAVDAVAGAGVVLLLVPDGAAVGRALDELLPGLAPGALVVDMTTSSVEEKLAFAERMRAARARPAEAPFFGTVPQAAAGELFAIVGCDDADEDDVRSALAPLCSGLFRHGGVGEASALKLACNVLVFPMVELIAEALALAEAQGVDPSRLLELLAAGTGVRSPIYEARGRLIVDRDFAARASVALAGKDLELIHEAATEAGLELPLLERTREVFAEARAAGLEGEDMAAVAKLLRRESS